MTEGTDILTKIKEGTRREHESIEGQLGVMDPQLSLPAYRYLLQKMYGFYEPVEKQIQAAESLRRIGFHANSRMKTAWLEEDLRTLGETPEAIRGLPRLTNFELKTDAASLLGVLYVLEGSTLGGRFITAHVLNRFQWTEPHGVLFFRSYGPARAEKWKEFQRALLEQIRTADDEKHAIAAAQETFRALEKWMTSAP